MSLDNLVGISLEKININNSVIKRLLSAAERNIADSHVMEISSENRFDVAYKAIMQLANASLQAHGYRTLTSKPGHHVTMLQTLVHTIGLDNKTIIVLDSLRKQRNVVDYSGDIIPSGVVTECVTYAENLFLDVSNWLRKNKPELFK